MQPLFGADFLADLIERQLHQRTWPAGRCDGFKTFCMNIFKSIFKGIVKGIVKVRMCSIFLLFWFICLLVFPYMFRFCSI